MSAPGNHHHRSLLKQSNKNYKGKSKNHERRQQTGRMEDRVSKASATDPALKKRDRQNRAKQIQQNKRNEAQQKLRIGSRTGPPRVLALISLHAHSSTASLRDSILQYVQSVGGTIEHAPQSPFRVKSEDAKTSTSVDREFKPHPLMATFSVQIDKRVQRFTLYDCPRDALAVLDVAKVADVLCFTVSAANMESGAESARSAYASEDEAVDGLGRHFLSLIKAQGLPAHTATIQNLKQVTPKHQLAARRTATEALHSAVDPDLKAFLVDSPEDNQQFLRWISNLRLKDIQWRDSRSFLLAEAVHYTPPSAAAPVGSLAISGYIRGKRPLSVNQLVHLTGFGDYQLGAIETYAEAERRRDRTHSTKSGDIDMAAPAASAAATVAKTTVVQVPNPEQQESLESLIPANPLATTAQDQSIITDEELAEAAKEHAKAKAKKQLDKAGYYKPERKDIQSVWDEIVSDDEDDDGKLRDDDTKTEAGGGDIDADEEEDEEEKMEKQKQQESDEMMWPDEVETPRDIPAKVRFTKYRGLKNFRSAMWDKYENLPVEYSRIYTFERFQQTRKRVTALPTKPAHAPTASRRGSMDAAMTDPSQQPSSFGSAAPFVFAPPAGSNFTLPAPLSAPSDSKSQEPMDLGNALNETAAFQFSDGVEEGTRIVLHVKDVSPEVAARIGAVFGVSTAGIGPVTQLPLSLWGLLEYEHRVSVLHFLLRRHAEDLETPLKGKEPMVFSCGFRRYVGRPIFTQDGSGDKFQMERFFMKDRFSVASIYGRIMFPPAPVLAFRANFNPADRSSINFGPMNSPAILPLGLSLGPCPTPFNPLVATGTLTSVDPNRLLIKRVILTGAPISVHKRHAVVRHMFYNPDDVRWFKPVEIWTKHGVKGVINEPRGTKGYMKCSFDRLIKQNDTVCMTLYKRQYPPWHPELFEGRL